MKHVYELKVYHADTDCYGIVWHGNYLRFCEQARCEMCSFFGLPMSNIEQNGFCTPLTEAALKYKHPAKVHDTLMIETTVEKITPLRATLFQKIINKNTGVEIADVTVTFVCTDKNGNLQKKMPKQIYDLLKKIQNS